MIVNYLIKEKILYNNIRDKDIDNFILKDIKNEKLNSSFELIDEIVMIRINDYKKRRSVIYRK